MSHLTPFFSVMQLKFYVRASCVLDGVRKTQKEIATASGVTEVTVRNRYKGLREVLDVSI